MSITFPLLLLITHIPLRLKIPAVSPEPLICESVLFISCVSTFSQYPSLSPCHHFPPPTSFLHPNLLTSQATNGPSSGYAYSLPSTPVVGHRELRVVQGEGGGSVNTRQMKNIPRRPSLFKVSRHCCVPVIPHHHFTPLSCLSLHLSWSSCCSYCLICSRTGTQIKRPVILKGTSAWGGFPLNRFV